MDALELYGAAIEYVDAIKGKVTIGDATGFWSGTLEHFLTLGIDPAYYDVFGAHVLDLINTEFSTQMAECFNVSADEAAALVQDTGEEEQ